MLDGLNLNIGLGGETPATESETRATPRPDVENVIIIGSGPAVTMSLMLNRPPGFNTR